MPQFNYKEKVLNFINEIHDIVENKKESEYQELIEILHKIFFYSEQYFIEKSLRYRNLPHKAKDIEEEKKEVLARLRSYVEAVDRLNQQTSEMLSFLTNWGKRLEYEDSLHDSQIHS